MHDTMVRAVSVSFRSLLLLLDSVGLLQSRLDEIIFLTVTNILHQPRVLATLAAVGRAVAAGAEGGPGGGGGWGLLGGCRLSHMSHCYCAAFRACSRGWAGFRAAEAWTPCDILLRLRQWEPDCVRSPSAGRQLRLRRARFDSHSYQVDGHLRPRVEGAG